MCDTFGRRLRGLRLEKGLTQLKLARQLGKADSTIRMWELGKNQPDYASLTALARIFAVSVDYLLGYGEPLPPSRPQPLAAEKPLHQELLAAISGYSDEDIATLIRIARALKA